MRPVDCRPLPPARHAKHSISGAPAPFPQFVSGPGRTASAPPWRLGISSHDESQGRFIFVCHVCVGPSLLCPGPPQVPPQGLKRSAGGSLLEVRHIFGPCRHIWCLNFFDPRTPVFTQSNNGPRHTAGMFAVSFPPHSWCIRCSASHQMRFERALPSVKVFPPKVSKANRAFSSWRVGPIILQVYGDNGSVFFEGKKAVTAGRPLTQILHLPSLGQGVSPSAIRQKPREGNKYAQSQQPAKGSWPGQWHIPPYF